MPSVALASLPLRNRLYCSTHHFDICLQNGQVYIRAQTPDYGITTWTLLQFFKQHCGSGLYQLYQSLEEATIKYMSADESNLLLINQHNHPFYAKLDDHDDKIEWIEQWGLRQVIPGKKSRLHIDKHLIYFSMSHAPAYKLRFDGHHVPHSNLFGITTVAAYNIKSGYIVLSDPWWRNNFSIKICPPNGEKIVDLSYSASTLFVRTENGQLYTLLYDFDTGLNPLVRYHYSTSAIEQIRFNHSITRFKQSDKTQEQHQPSLSKKLIKNSLTVRHCPMGLWRHHNSPDTNMSVDNITIMQCGFNNRDDFLMTVWGKRQIDNSPAVFGYYYKTINATNWQFTPVKRSLIYPYVTNPINPELVTAVKQVDLQGTIKLNNHRYTIELSKYNPYKDYNLIKVHLNDELSYSLYLFSGFSMTFNNKVHTVASLVMSKELKHSSHTQACFFKQSVFGSKTATSLPLKRNRTNWSLSANRNNVFSQKPRIKIKLTPTASPHPK